MLDYFLGGNCGKTYDHGYFLRAFFLTITIHGLLHCLISKLFLLQSKFQGRRSNFASSRPLPPIKLKHKNCPSKMDLVVEILKKK